MKWKLSRKSNMEWISGTPVQKQGTYILNSKYYRVSFSKSLITKWKSAYILQQSFKWLSTETLFWSLTITTAIFVREVNDKFKSIVFILIPISKWTITIKDTLYQTKEIQFIQSSSVSWVCTAALYVGGKLKLFNHFSDFFMMTIQFYSISFHQLENFSLHIVNQFLWFDRPMYIVIIKGGLISESFSLWLKSPKKGANPEHYPPEDKILKLVIWHLFKKSLSQSENLSEIKLPLLLQAFPQWGEVISDWAILFLSTFHIYIRINAKNVASIDPWTSERFLPHCEDIE